MADVFIQHHVVDPAGCARLRAAMDAGRAEAAEILDAGPRLDEAVRLATVVDVDAAALRDVERLLDRLRDRVARRFDVSISGREGPGFLRYQAGGRYLPHRDRGDVDGWPAAARRQVAVVLFLNSSRAVDPAGDFSGGALAIYPDDEGAPVVIHPRAGTLAAFPADTLHEVLPVTAGVRDAVVDWFY